jgi:hypothetical protein
MDKNWGMPPSRRLTLEAMLAVVILSCARAPPRDAGRAPPSGDGAAPASRTRPEDETAGAPQRVDDERPRPRTRAAPDSGPTTEADRPPPTPAEVREAVSDVATARGLPAYGTPRALLAIAGMLEQIAGGHSPGTPSIAAMRLAIQDLERLGGIDLDRADHVKEALERGIEATRAFARTRGAEWLDPWVEAAARAVGAIDPASPLGLQRAVVQDALRSLADAVLVAGQFADR